MNTGLNIRCFESTFVGFRISCMPPYLFLQRLMRNYDDNALLSVSNTEATVHIAGIKIYVHASNAHLAQTFKVILQNRPLWTPFKNLRQCSDGTN